MPLRPILVGAVVAFGIAATQGPAADRPLRAPRGTLSPDGQLVSYFDTTGPELRVDRVDREESVARIPVSGYIGSSAISWDGKMVSFSSGIRGQGPGLRVAALPPASDVSPRLLIKGPDIDPVEWSRDGTEILAAADLNQYEIRLINVADGTFRILKTMTPTSRQVRFLALSPDAAQLAYDDRVAGAGRDRAVFLMPIKGGPEERLIEATAWHSVIGWSPDGRELLVFSDRDGSPALWALPVRDGRAVGDLRLVKRDFDGKPMAVTANGDVVYERVSGPPAARLVTARIDGDARLASPPEPYATRDTLAFARFPRWSPDGRLFMYVTVRLLTSAVVVHDTSTRQSRDLSLPFRVLYTFDWSRDSRSVVFKAVNHEGQFCLCVLDIATGNVQSAHSGSVYYQPQYSTDGRRVSYFTRPAPPAPQQPAQPVNWSYVELEVATGTVRPLVNELSQLMADPRSYPAGRSPDGRYLLAEVVGDPSRLLAYDTTSTQVREIHRAAGTQAFNHYGDLQWTPDSRAVITTIATALREGGNEQEIWWIPVDGRGAHKIDIGTTMIGENPIAIHPDGRQIAFVLGKPFYAVMPFDLRPGAVGSPVEKRLLSNIFGPSKN